VLQIQSLRETGCTNNDPNRSKCERHRATIEDRAEELIGVRLDNGRVVLNAKLRLLLAYAAGVRRPRVTRRQARPHRAELQQLRRKIIAG
jgi:hypothetical protein